MRNQYIISKVWVDDARVWLETNDGIRVSTEFAKWRRLCEATQSQREHFFLSRFGIHWPLIDEDLNYEGILVEAGLCLPTASENSVYYQA